MDINNLWSEYDLNSKKQNSRCLAVNTILEGKYLVGPVLGQGGFGITYVGYDLNMETKVAIKEYFPVELVSRDTTTMHGDRVLSLSGEKSVTYKAGLKKYVAEAQNVSQFSEVPGVVSVKDFFYANETAYIVMEFIDGISLKDYLKEQGGRLSEEDTLKIMRPILDALVQVHKSGIIHRDISPDNIMLTFIKPGDKESGIAVAGNRKIKSVKLIDFGAARMTEKNDQKSLTIILKHGYAPEEQYRTHGEQGPWTDVYALCAVLYRMLTGETPVPAMDRMFKDELKALEQCGAKVSANTAAAILKGLAVKKDDRIQNVQTLIEALYEGKNIRSSEKNSAKKYWGLGLGVAGLAAALAAVVFVSGNKEKTDIVQPLTTVAESSVSQENETLQTSEVSANTEIGIIDDEVGTQIVWPKVETMLAYGDRHILSLREDGTVWAAGDNYRGQCEVTDWDHIAAVYANEYISAGLRTDGTVVVAGNAKQEWVDSWSGIVELAVGYCHIIGLTQDGRVLSAGADKNGSCDTGEWKDIEHIDAGSWVSVGITKDGKVKVAGIPEEQKELKETIEQWTDICSVRIRSTANDTYYAVKEDGSVVCAGEHKNDDESKRIVNEQDAKSVECSSNTVASLRNDGTVACKERPEVEEWRNVVSLAVTDIGIVGLKEDGTFEVTEANDGGNSSLEEVLALENAEQAVWTDDCLNILCSDGTIKSVGYANQKGIEVLEEKKIQKLDNTSQNELAGLTAEGTIHRYKTAGIRHDGSLDSEELRRRFEMTPDLASEWTNIKDISCSSRHIVALLEDGTVKAAGYPEYQVYTDYQTGLTTDGACDVSDWTDIRQVVALTGITVGLKEDGTLVCAGNYPERWDEEWKQYDNIASIWGEGTFVGNRLTAITEDGKVIGLYVIESEGQGNFGTWSEMVQLGVGDYHTVGLKADGTVYAVGSNFCGQCDVEDWKNVASIAVGSSATVGITTDGKVLMAGRMPRDIYVAETWSALPLEQMTKVDAASEMEGVAASEILTIEENTEEMLGEQIAFYKPETSIATGRGNPTLFCMPDGTVKAFGNNQNGECEVEDWTNIVAVAAENGYSFGLRSDGTVRYAGDEKYREVERWENIVQIWPWMYGVSGVQADGTVVTLVDMEDDRTEAMAKEMGSWNHILALDGNNGDLYGLKEDGTVLHAAINGGAPEYKIWDEVEELCTIEWDVQTDISQFFGDYEDVKSWENVQAVVRPAYGILYGLTTDGTILECILNTGNSEVVDFKNLAWIDYYSEGSIIGCTKDGRVLTYGLQFSRAEKDGIYSLDHNLIWYSGHAYLMDDGSAELLRAEKSFSDVKQVVEVSSGSRGEYGCCYVMVMNDGTVQFYVNYPDTKDWAGDLERYERMAGAAEWTDIEQIVPGRGELFGLKKDGTLVYAGEGNYSADGLKAIYGHEESSIVAITKDGKVECIRATQEEIASGMFQTAHWENIQQLAMGTFHTAGLCNDGTVVASGKNYAGQCNVEEWEDVVYVAAGGTCTLGITSEGELLIAGSLY